MLKAITFNIHKFYDLLNLRYTIEPLRDFLRSHDFDFVFLQEVRGVHPKKHDESYQLDPLEFLADQVWTEYAYGKNAVYDGGHHGNAILSKYPILEWSNHDISNHSLERRSLLHAKVMIDNKSLDLMCTHLDLTQWGRRRQINRIMEIIESETESENPVVFAGDFNDWNGRIKSELTHNGFSVVDGKKSYPSKLPLFELDRIFYKKIRLHGHGVIDSKAAKKLSDHIPLYCEFEIQ